VFIIGYIHTFVQAQTNVTCSGVCLVGVDTDGYQMNCIADRPAPAYLSVGSESQAASGTAMLCESGEELPDLQDGSVKEGVLAGSK